MVPVERITSKIYLIRGQKVMLDRDLAELYRLVDPRCIKIMDIKCPSSGEAGKNDLGNLERLSDQDEVKFVIGTREDYEFAKGILEKHLEGKTVLLSTAFGQLNPRIVAEWILEDRLNVRFQLQLHKYIWSPDKRGV